MNPDSSTDTLPERAAALFSSIYLAFFQNKASTVGGTGARANINNGDLNPGLRGDSSFSCFDTERRIFRGENGKAVTHPDSD